MSATYSRRRLLQLAGAGTLGLTMAGCAPSAGDDTGDSSDAESTGEQPRQDFTFATWSVTEDAPKPVIEGMLDTFGDQSGVTIDTISWPWNEYLNQFTLAVQGNQFSGPAQLDIPWLSALAPLGKLRDLGPIAERHGYTDSALAAGQHEGTQYGLPWTIGAIGLVTNTELLEEAGITSAPTTIEEFEDVLTELKGLGDRIIPYAASTKVGQLRDVLTWMATFGSPILDGDEVTIGDDASIDAITWYKKLYDDGLIAPDVDRFDARALFAQGTAAIYDDSMVARGSVVAESPDPDMDSKLDVFTRPVLAAGDTPRGELWGHLVVVVEGEEADTASEFAEWLTSDTDTVVGYFDELALPPTTREGLDSESVQSDEFTSAFVERVVATATPNPFWRYPQYAQIEQAMAEQIEAVLVGISSPADAMRTAGEAMQSLI
jgi:multiple sugar transport system substrate-binding protein